MVPQAGRLMIKATARISTHTNTWQFAGPHKQYLGAKVVAGSSSSVVIDRQGMYYVAGKVRFLASRFMLIYVTDDAFLSFLVEEYGRW